MKLNIYDTGYYTKDNLSNQADHEDRAGYDGVSTTVWIELNVKSVTRNAGANIDDGVNVGNYTTTDLNFTSFANATYDFECYINKNDTTSLTYEHNQLTQIMRLEKTKGIKVIYPSNATDTRKGIIELLGAYNAVNGIFQGSGKPLSAGKNYISGRVLKISGLKDDAKSDKFTFKITFECVEEVQDN